MGLDDVNRFGQGLRLVTLLGPALALAVVWPRRGALAPLRWLLAAVLGGVFFVVHVQMALSAFQFADRAVSVVGVALCLAIAARWGAVTSTLGARSWVLSASLSRAVLLLMVWVTLTLGVWLASG